MKPKSIIVDGSAPEDATSHAANRHLVIIDDRNVYLPPKMFCYFVKLAWGRVNNRGGWVVKYDIEPGHLQARYIYRMRNEIFKQLESEEWPVVQNSGAGSYRLDAPPASIDFVISNLVEFYDYTVASLFKDIVEIKPRESA